MNVIWTDASYERDELTTGILRSREVNVVRPGNAVDVRRTPFTIPAGIFRRTTGISCSRSFSLSLSLSRAIWCRRVQPSVSKLDVSFQSSRACVIARYRTRSEPTWEVARLETLRWTLRNYFYISFFHAAESAQLRPRKKCVNTSDQLPTKGVFVTSQWNSAFSYGNQFFEIPNCEMVKCR